MTHRIERRLVDVGPTLRALDVGPVLARVYAGRGVRDAAELEHTLERLLDFRALRGIDEAVELLVHAVTHGERILIVGDFDADGATSTAVAVRALRACGARDVHYVVPDRFRFGYGLTPEIVAVALQREPALIITVDNGISSVAGVAAAKAEGVRVLVTDHHLPGATLPAADAIVNPNQPDDAFPSKAIAGVGVIFYVMLALRAALRTQDWFAKRGMREPNLAELLDLVALGTVADVVPLDHNNRILVAQGLARIRAGRCCPGIQALFEVAGRSRSIAVAGDLGFAVAPRLNAAGRLEDMGSGIACLLSDEPGEARRLAQRLDGLNRERRVIEAQMHQQAVAHIETLLVDEDSELPLGVCLFDEDWHEGVVGIVASRIKERLHRPVIAFAATDAQTLKGSGRSVAGLHMRDALDSIAARHPGMLSKFGGHAMAAGLSLERSHFEDFAAAFNEEVGRHVSEDQLRGVVVSDGELSADEVSLELAESLRYAGPWGQGFPEPVFDGCFEVVQRRIVGERHLKLVLRLANADQLIDAIAFNTTDADWPPATSSIWAAYRLDVNEYLGARSVQLVIEHLQPC